MTSTMLNVDYNEEARFNVWLGKGILLFGIAFNAFLGYTLGFGAFAIGMAVLVVLFDLAKIRMTRNTVLGYKSGETWFFPALWVVTLTLLSMGAGTMFYAYNMDRVARVAHENSADVQLSKRAFDLAESQAAQAAGFDMLGTAGQIGEIESQMAAILDTTAQNSNGRNAGTIGSTTNDCTKSSGYYAKTYAQQCSQYSSLYSKKISLKEQMNMTTDISTQANQTAQQAMSTMQAFSIAEGVPGFKVLAKFFYPHLPEDEAVQTVFTQTTITVAIITELLGTSLILYGYILGLRTTSPAPSFDPTGSDDSSRHTHNRDSNYQGTGAGFSTADTSNQTRAGAPKSYAPPTPSPSVSRMSDHPNWRPSGQPEQQIDIDEIIYYNRPEGFTGRLGKVSGSPLGKAGEGFDGDRRVHNAYLEILRAIHHGYVKNPSFPQCKKILQSCKIGNNSNEREALIEEVMERLMKPENVVIDNPKRGEAGQSNWLWHSDFVKNPQNWNRAEWMERGAA